MKEQLESLTRYEVGIDTGGTFTDVVCRSASGEVRRAKLSSTPADPMQAILSAVDHIKNEWGIDQSQIERFVHGTTVATNAVLERKGALTGLITTRGFRDVLELGRSNRKDEDLYNMVLTPNVPNFLAPAARRMEVSERVGADGTIVTPLNEDELLAAADLLVSEGVISIAICFLFSFLDPAHEKRAAELIRSRHPHVSLSLSSFVDPSYREYERTAITCFDAYVKPTLASYLHRTDTGLHDKRVSCGLQVIHSRGGVTTADTATERPVRLFLSGPAGGVIGCQALTQAAGVENAITVDIGGTSSDIALISKGKPMISNLGWIDGFAVRVPMVDVNSIGSGGGSIAWLDAAGGLHVGPQSSGASPGPACYGRGGEQPTVTDASLVLGYLNPDTFAGGRIPLRAELASEAIKKQIATPMGISVIEAALGIHRVVNAQMAEGIRFVSVKRGHDPRRFSLIPLGGGGGMHATPLARILQMSKVLVPQLPGVLSAVGLLSAPIEHERSVGYPRKLVDTTPDELHLAFGELDASCAELMDREITSGLDQYITHSADVCYVGQSHHIEVPVDLSQADPRPDLYANFLKIHYSIYGHAAERPVRIVNLRAVHQALQPEPPPLKLIEERGEASEETYRQIVVEGSLDPVRARIVDRTTLRNGDVVQGPAIIEQSDTTTLIEPGWTARVRSDGLLQLDR
ncbi:N-methylhydantoinase A [Caballeronia udeis]|uniref:N-methylhydantoinase A n=1 Tax=Caballeronia udeis TaxID=1232866 RepID=A0ABW8MYW8_9BURK